MESRPVLAAADFSEASDEAIRQADARVRTGGGVLHVCQVLPDPLQITPLLPMTALPYDVAETRVDAEARLRERVTLLTQRDATEVEVRVLVGIPHATIIAEAERIDAAIVVVGSHGRTGVAHVLLGSVAERTVRYASCPVLVARPRTRTGLVLVATDFSDPALPAVMAAAHEAARMGGRIAAVHCIDLAKLDWTGFIAAPARMTISEHAVEEMRRSAKARLAGALEHVGATGDGHVLEGSAGPAIVEAAARLNAEIVIVGTSGRTGLKRVVLGSVAETVIRHAPQSVLVVRLHPAPAAAPA